MKKLSLIIAILFAACTIAWAQPRAIGGRLPVLSIGASYQHGLGEKNMLQADIDLLDYYRGIQGTVTYNWIFPIASWGIGDMNWYAGVGAGGGYAWYYLGSWGGYYGRWHEGWWGGQYGFVGAAGMAGIEMNFKFGLQVSFDYRPLIGPRIHRGDNQATYFVEGLYTGAINFGVRYRFK